MSILHVDVLTILKLNKLHLKSKIEVGIEQNNMNSYYEKYVVSS